MPIKVKSIFDKPAKEDGWRIIVSRTCPKLKNKESWMPGLAPSWKLLSDWKVRRITWEEYEKRYLEEMMGERSRQTIKHLLRAVVNGETITLLCYERNGEHCHRYLLKDILEKALLNYHNLPCGDGREYIK